MRFYDILTNVQKIRHVCLKKLRLDTFDASLGLANLGAIETESFFISFLDVCLMLKKHEQKDATDIYTEKQSSGFNKIFSPILSNKFLN